MQLNILLHLDTYYKLLFFLIFSVYVSLPVSKNVIELNISLVYDFILIHHFLVSVAVIEALLCVKFKSILATNAFISCIHVNCELYWFWIKEKYLKGSFSCDVKIKFHSKYVCQHNILWIFPRISTRFL